MSFLTRFFHFGCCHFRFLSALLILFSYASCKNKKSPDVFPSKSLTHVDSSLVKAKDFSNVLWIDTLLGFRTDRILYCKKYLNDSCALQKYTSENLKEDFEGVKPLSHIRTNNVSDSVFVLPPLNFCDSGDSYYFSDTSLPRLETDSYCCHPTNIFVTDDIDEDGIHEIVEFYSSCASRYKALRVWSIKNGTWKNVASVDYDLFHNKIKMKNRIRKTGKGRFQLLELTDESIKIKGEKGDWVDHTL
jgi:hypothetical protein